MTATAALVVAFAIACVAVWLIRSRQGTRCERCGLVRYDKRNGGRSYVYPEHADGAREIECRALGHKWKP